MLDPIVFNTSGKMFCLITEILLRTQSFAIHSIFSYKNIVFPAQAEYSYFSADFSL